MTNMIKTTTSLLLGLALASACGGDDANGDELGTETASETGTTTEADTSDSSDDPGTSDATETGEDPNAECSNSWDAVQKKDSGQTHAGYGVAVAGDGSFAVVGKLENVAEVDDDAWIGMFTPSAELIWDEVVDSGQGKDYAQAVTLDAAGDVVLVGSLNNTNKDLWVEKRDAATGAIAWTVIEASNFAGDNLPGDIALAPDGGLVVSATIRSGDKDSDIGLRKLASVDGSTIWAASTTGAPDPNGYSIDRAGPVGVAADGSIYVGGEEGVDANTKEGTLSKFGPDGGAPQWRLAPREDGSEHLHEVVAVAGGPEGEAYFVVHQGADPSPFWLYRAAGDATIEWELSRAEFEYAPTDGWLVIGLDLAADGSLTIGGRLTNEEVGQDIAWSEAWMANIRLDDGFGSCLSSHTWKNAHIIPASTYAYGFAEGPDGVIMVGEIVDGPENYLWVGGYE